MAPNWVPPRRIPTILVDMKLPRRRWLVLAAFAALTVLGCWIWWALQPTAIATRWGATTSDRFASRYFCVRNLYDEWQLAITVKTYHRDPGMPQERCSVKQYELLPLQEIQVGEYRYYPLDRGQPPTERYEVIDTRVTRHSPATIERVRWSWVDEFKIWLNRQRQNWGF
jgi:hypothetical protein